MIYFLDTNVFIRVIARDDERMVQECERLFEKVQTGQIEAVTSVMVITEIGWLLKSFYKFPRLKIASLLVSINKMKGLTISGNPNMFSALEYYQTTNISLTDAMIAGIPKVISKEWTVVSYDEDFRKLPVLWKKPGDL